MVDRRSSLLAGIDAAVWFALSVAVGAAAARVPTARLAEDGLVTRLRRLEDGGRLWERLGVRRWKDRLPDAGGAFGGPARALMIGRREWWNLAAETRRAELVHWTLVVLSPAFGLWNPRWLTTAMVLFAATANLPCIIVQRYNRARVLRLATPRR